METKKPFVLKEILSGESGHLSSKRVLGGIVLMSCLIFTIIQAVREGMTDNLKELFEWLIITSTALLGINSVTSIWKGKKPKNDE
jgi:hypothetical protein